MNHNLFCVFLVFFVSFSEEIVGQGLLLSKDDLRTDKGLVEVAPAPTSFGGAGYPEKFSLRNRVPKPGDQGTANSCVGWTLGYGLLSTLLNKKDEPLSPEFIYRWGLSIAFNENKESKWRDRGVDFGHGFLVFPNEGCCPYGRPKLKTFMDDKTNPPGTFVQFDTITDSIKLEGHQNRVFIAPQKIPQTELEDSIKSELLKNHPVPCGFMIHKSLRNGVGLEPMAGKEKNCLWRIPYNPGSKSSHCQHAMLVVGYDESIRAFEVMNSFGTDFADGGFLWISYDLMNDLGEDPSDRSDNPCCLVAWSYTFTKIEDSLANDTNETEKDNFSKGKISGWVRILDRNNEFNFDKSEGGVTQKFSNIEEVKNNEKISANQALFVRRAINAVGNAPTSGAPDIGNLKSGDPVIVKDLKMITFDGGKTKEYWVKVRSSQN